MISLVTKLSPNTFRHNFGIVRLNYRIRNYATKKADPLCPPPKPKSEASTGTAVTLGLITFAGIATIGYAKYDKDFRKFLGDNIPGADDFFKFIFMEEGSITEKISGYADSILGTDDCKTTTSSSSSGRTSIKNKEGDQIATTKEKDYSPPRPVFPEIAKDKKEDAYNEIRVQKENKEVDIVKEKPQPEVGSVKSPKTLADLEVKIAESAIATIKAYHRAEVALRDYNRDVDIIVEDSVDRINPEVWKSLKKKTDTKNEILKEALSNTKKTMKDLETFKKLLNDSSIVAPVETKATAVRNAERLTNDIRQAKEDYEKENRAASVTEKYWQKVETARKHFINELEILFPDFDVSKQKFQMQPSDLDLFIVHAFANVLYLQKELNNLDMIGQKKLDLALQNAKKGDPNFSIVEAAIMEGIEREKRKLTLDFRKKCLALRKESEMELRHRLKCQEQAHVDHLTDVLQTREQELEREFNRKLDEHIVQEQGKSKMQMAGMIARMKGMRNAITERVESDKMAHQSQVLWSACQALHRAVKTSIPGVAWTDQMKPLEAEVDAIQKAAADGDELVATVLGGIPKEAVNRGVYPEGAIRERFLKVERVARRLALVPEDGGRLPLYLLSYIQSILLINNANPIPQAELADEKIDFSELDTYDILQRARYWLDRGNYAQTLKYMNLLKGASRCIASDWMKETRILLETQQAAETLMAHAVAGGLLHL